jgi:hypothetical protein
MAPYIDPTEVFQSGYHAGSPNLPMAHEDMFGFGGDSDNKGEEGAAFADRTYMT